MRIIPKIFFNPNYAIILNKTTPNLIWDLRLRVNLKYTMFILIIVVFLLQMIVLKQDSQINSNEKTTTLKPTIALSTFPLFDIAKNIAKDKINTYMILPAGVDIHSYEPNPKDIIKLHKSSLVVYSGASLEPWISKQNFKNKTLDMSKHVDLIELEKDLHDEHGDHGESCSHGQLDPHYWLSIQNMKKATFQITKLMINLDIKNKNFYLKNQNEYIKSLNALDSLYKSTLSKCKTNEILTNHNAFSYIAQSYGFEIISLSKLSPDAQTSAKNMIKLIGHIQEHNISTIFYESFASSNAISAIAKESNIKIDLLQPLANITADEQKQNLSYEDIMRQNLSKLKDAMDCQ